MPAHRSNFGALAAVLLLVSCSAAADQRPNIVLILSDDQAWGDYGFMGHEVIQTPNLDRLAASGITYPRGYVAAPVCRPSLASIVTGHYPSRHGVTGNDVQGDHDRAALDAPLRGEFHKHPSFIRLLSDAGYLTHQSGKWWEGSHQDGGFTAGMTHGDPSRGGRHGDAGLVIGREGMRPVTDFIDHAAESQQPFFLWYAPFLPHAPHRPPQRLLQKHQLPGRPADAARYYAMCEWFDETCGQLLDHLQRKQLADNTLVLYLCDNGWAPVSDNAADLNQSAWTQYALRSKGSPYENGVRTPILVSWPGHAAPRQSDQLAHAIDLFPTIAAAAGLDAPAGLPGVNLLDAQAVREREIVFGVCHATHNIDLQDPDSTLQYLWCVTDPWKLIVRRHGVDSTKYRALHDWDTVPARLYNLRVDPHEQRDLAAERPEVVERLRRSIDAWRAKTPAPAVN
ncbi:Arylsulfatase [Posidoniimonas polymericola]|uniref:Arylsulfatase n=1 Tax=Posidoniimonas polymericola TaxID=2528002 RepID=A0A5C5YRA0_9BACT|nr:sulfatase-like hydrolase/transferase [Posidoniimonas polymericola]TWT77472.1 Arylsulfatase [Posidoniimonas polymericola]